MSSSQPSRAGDAGRIAAPLDDVDRQILRELTADGRMSVSVLAERVNVSRANAYSRLERLKESGVLTGFTAVVDQARVGLTTSAYVTLNVRQHSRQELIEALSRIPEVKSIATVGGECDVILLVRATDDKRLREVVLDGLHGIPGVLGTRTFLIFEELDNR